MPARWSPPGTPDTIRFSAAARMSIIAHGKESDRFSQGSCTIALTTLEIAALPFNLGTCWAGFLLMAAHCSPQVYQALGLPQGNVMQGGLMIGYPQETYHAIPPRKPLNVEWRF